MPNAARLDPTLLAARCHAASDPTRMALLGRLAGGEHCVCDLTDLLDAAQSRLSFHLKVLRESGLVAGRREGRWMYYRLVPEALEETAAALSGMAEEARRAPSEGCRCCGSC